MAKFVIPVYIAVTALVMLLTDNCIRDVVTNTGRRRNIRRIIHPAFILLQLLEILGTYLPDNRIRYLIQGAGNVWFGFFSVYGSFLLFFTILAVLADVFSKKRVSQGRRANVFILVASLAATVLFTGYAMVHAQRPVVKHYDVTIPEESEGSESAQPADLRIVLIADLHLSCNSRPQLMQRMVDLVNEQDPDVVLVAGDIFTSSYKALSDPEQYARILRGMQAREGVYAVYGNHDCEEDLFIGFPVTPVEKAFRSEEMVQFFKDAGFTVLDDQMVTASDGRIQIIGREDGEKAGDGTADRSSADQVLALADPDKPVIVLEHEPKEYADLKEAGADLVLSGHTHNGQVFPGNLGVRLFNENAYGYKEINDLQTLVTSGVGYFGPPMRLGTNSEVAVIDLHFYYNEE